MNQNISDIIREISNEMYIDERGDNVLNGDTEGYKKKWRFEIGFNSGLQKAIDILKLKGDK